MTTTKKIKLTRFRIDLTRHLNDINDSGEIIELTKHGKTVGVVMTKEMYELFNNV